MNVRDVHSFKAMMFVCREVTDLEIDEKYYRMEELIDENMDLDVQDMVDVMELIYNDLQKQLKK